METFGNPSIWAQYGGLSGLVIMALFVVLAIAVWSAKGMVSVFRDEICKMLDNHAKEREKWGEIIDSRQRESNEAIRGMTVAINKLAERHRHYDCHIDDIK